LRVRFVPRRFDCGEVKPLLITTKVHQRNWLCASKSACASVGALLQAVDEKTMRIHPLDCVIVVSYLLAITAPACASAANSRTLRDYFLGGRPRHGGRRVFDCPTKLRTLTIIGPRHFLRGNLNFLQLVFGYLVGRVLIVLLLLPGYFRENTSPPMRLSKNAYGEKNARRGPSTF